MASAGVANVQIYHHFNMRASYIDDQNEVAQIRSNTIAVWNEVILKKVFTCTSTCFVHF